MTLDMNKISEILGVNKLDEETQASVKEHLQKMVDEKAEELSNDKVEEKVQAGLEEKKQELVEQYEEKFEEYKSSLLEKFSNFVDDVLEEKLQIPENIVEYARLGELYHDLVEQFKTRLAIDQDMIDEEAKDLIREARDEIQKLRDEKNQLTEKYLTTKGHAQEFSAALYISEKCKGLTESQKEYVTSILEGITDKETIDEKFDKITESYQNVSGNELEEGDDTHGNGKENVNEDHTQNPENDIISFYANLV